MTKAELIRTLEVFDDDIEIVILNDKNYKYEPRVYYHFDTSDDAAKIILAGSFVPQGKCVELKVK